MSQTSSFKFGDRVVHAARPEWGPGTVVRVESVHEQGKPAQRLQIRFPGVGLKVINTAVASIVSAEDMPSILDQPEPTKPEVPTPVVKTTRHATTDSAARANAASNGTPSTVPAQTTSVDPSPATKPGTHAAARVPARESNGESSSSSSAPPSDAAKRNGWLSSLEQKNPADLMVRIPDAAGDPFRNVWDRLKTTLDLYRFNAEARSMTDWAVAQSGIEDPLTIFNRQELETLFAKWTRLRDSHLTTLVEEAEREEGGGDKIRTIIRKSGQDAAKQALRRFDARR